MPKLIEEAQKKYEHLIVTQFYNQPGSFFRKLIDWHKIDRGSDDYALAFNPRPDAIRIEKSIYSFVNEPFLALLDERNIKTIDIAGVDTDICVTKCAVDLIESGRVPRVLSQLCASTAGPEHHNAAINILRRYIGSAQVVVKEQT